MLTVSSIFEAYLHFQPYNPNRDSETVVIDHGDHRGIIFLSWDKALRIFTRDDGRGNVGCFQGYLIDTMGTSSRAYLASMQTEGATVQ